MFCQGSFLHDPVTVRSNEETFLVITRKSWRNVSSVPHWNFTSHEHYETLISKIGGEIEEWVHYSKDVVIFLLKSNVEPEDHSGSTNYSSI